MIRTTPGSLPGEFILANGGRCFVYHYGDVTGPLIAEHCVDGAWRGCYLGLAPDASLRDIRLKVLSHLERKRHGHEPPRLIGQDGRPHSHAGGGVQHQGVWVKMPEESQAPA